mmetsp:Transcript_57594/g.141668  ORF Transcript_57594/g.141668 Transcript_57594/m.141668 type:complete len:131 (-) Transcript_57594:59-451(-)
MLVGAVWAGPSPSPGPPHTIIEALPPDQREPASPAATTLETLIKALSGAVIFFLVAPGTFPAAAVLVGVGYKVWAWVRGRRGADEDGVEMGEMYNAVPASAYEAGKYGGKRKELFGEDDDGEQEPLARES